MMLIKIIIIEASARGVYYISAIINDNYDRCNWMIWNNTVALEIFHKCESDFGIFVPTCRQIFWYLFPTCRQMERSSCCWWTGQEETTEMMAMTKMPRPLDKNCSSTNRCRASPSQPFTHWYKSDVSFKHLLPKSGPFATVPGALRIAGALLVWVRPGNFLSINRTC